MILALSCCACATIPGAMLVGADGACGSSSPTPPAPDNPITVGVNISLTGSLSAFGQAEQNATHVAEAQINAYGGVLGHLVRFQIVDDATDTPTSTMNTQSFLGEKLPILLGPTGSGQAPGNQALVHGARIALISPSASTPVTRDAEAAMDRYFFRTAASHALQAKALALRTFRGYLPADGGSPPPDAGVTAAAGCSSVAVVHADDTYGDPISAGIASELTALGGSVAIDVKVPPTLKSNYDAEAAMVIAAKPQCQIVVSFPDVGVGYMRSFTKAIAMDMSRDWSTFISIGSNGLKTPQFVTLGMDPNDPSKPTIGEGMYIMNLDLNPDTPQYGEFRNLYTLTYPTEAGSELPSYTANQFDAAILAALAIEAAGGATDPVAVRNKLFDVSRPPGTAFSPARIGDALNAIRRGEDIDYDGASGPCDFDDYGEVLSSFVVYQIVAGQFAKLPYDTVKVEDLK